MWIIFNNRGVRGIVKGKLSSELRRKYDEYYLFRFEECNEIFKIKKCKICGNKFIKILNCDKACLDCKLWRWRNERL